ncbi:MAG: YncE family protein [Bacteroidia bacterium]
MKKNYINLHFKILFLLCFAIFLSCDKAPQTPDITVLPDSISGGVFIVNEGNYTQGNAELGFVNTGLKQRLDGIFKTANNRVLGDVFQSMNIINDKAYLVVNNSGKIEIINPKTFKSIGTVSGLHSPRYLTKISNSKAYVSDLNDNNIFVIDLQSNQIIKKIPVQGWAEEMLSLNGYTYITNVRSNKLLVIDEFTDEIIDSITTPFAPKNILKDSNNRIWILCGDVNAIDKRHFIIQLDVLNKNVAKKLIINTPNTAANRLRINKEGNTLFWIDEGVFKMNITDTLLPINPIVSKDNRIFYGLGIDPKYNEIFVSDAKDFNSNSEVYRYDFSGQLLGKFASGKITSDFYFYYN